MTTPLVLVSACLNRQGRHATHGAQHKYVEAAAGAGAMPLILPALAAGADLDAALDAVHGVLLSGSPSNVHPDRYGQPLGDADMELDPARDATTLPLIGAALARGMPLLAICRGFQELNVALGGTLHQAVHRVSAMMDHREDEAAALEAQYRPVHRVHLSAGGMLARMLGGQSTLDVNSLHGQGIDRLADALQEEARADDGLIEACSLKGGASFVLAVQWHPEWRFADDPVSQKILAAFGDACARYRRQRGRGAASGAQA